MTLAGNSQLARLESAEDLDPVSVVTPPEKSEFYLCRISRHCVWPPPSPFCLMDKSEPKPTPHTIQFADSFPRNATRLQALRRCPCCNVCRDVRVRCCVGYFGRFSNTSFA